MRIALITGAARGIGAAITAQLRVDGCKVLTPSRAEMDLASPESIENYLSGMDEEVDILVNNAGINKIATLDHIEPGHVAATLQINVLAALQITQFLASGMRSRMYGRIVNLSSIWSVVTRNGRSSYAMSKAAVNALTRSLAVELASCNILVNAVAPGYVFTDLTGMNNSPEEINSIAQTIPLGRLATPEEIANLVSFLCSDRNTYLTGQTIIIDGGYSCL